MSLIVQKFGGTSVGSVERIQAVAERVARDHAAGHRLVVVVSAMSGETDRLLNLARAIQNPPAPRELDSLLSTGEQVTIGLLAMALEARGVPAKSYTGAQVKILTDSAFNKARIEAIDPLIDANGRSISVRAVLRNDGPGEAPTKKGAPALKPLEPVFLVAAQKRTGRSGAASAHRRVLLPRRLVRRFSALTAGAATRCS
jgi:hypothetical protein